MEANLRDCYREIKEDAALFISIQLVRRDKISETNMDGIGVKRGKKGLVFIRHCLIYW